MLPVVRQRGAETDLQDRFAIKRRDLIVSPTQIESHSFTGFGAFDLVVVVIYEFVDCDFARRREHSDFREIAGAGG